MTKRILTMWLPLAALLTGCQSQALPVGSDVPSTPSFSIRETAPLARPKVLSETQTRRLMQVAGTASLWGARYTQSVVRGAYYDRNRRLTHYNNTSGDAAFSGKGELVRVSYNRYLYRVPADQVLVLNTVEGNGTVYVNGYGLGTNQPRAVHYLFGPGENVVLNYTPNVSHTRHIDGRQTYTNYAYYHPVAMSGFTVSPNLLGGTGALGGAK